MGNKELYIALCNEKNDIPFFLQPWWLDLVCETMWDVVIAKNKDQLVIGALPYFFVKRGTYKGIGLPLLTQYMGPILIYPNNQKYSKKLAFEKDVIQNLYLALPKVAFIKHIWNSNFTNWLPLYWLKYTQTTRFSYTLKNVSEHEKIFEGFETKIRGDIRKAEKIVTVQTTSDYTILYNQVLKTFIRKGMSMPYSESLIKRISALCIERSQGEIYYAIDENNNIHAAIFVVWDNHTAYYLLGGGDPEFRNSGATSLLLWNAIKELPIHISEFDFEGSMIEEVERFVRGFGAKQITLNAVSKTFSTQYYLLEKAYELKNRILNN